MTESSSLAQPSDREVDEYLNRLVHELYARAYRGDTLRDANDPVVAGVEQIDAILRAPDRFEKNYSLLNALGYSRFSTNGPQWQGRRDLTQPAYARAGLPANRSVVAATYAETLTQCDDAPPQAIPQVLLAASAKIFFLAFGRTLVSDSLSTFFNRTRRAIKRLQYHSWRSSPADEIAGLRSDVQSLLEEFAREISSAPQLLEFLRELQSGGAEIENFKALSELLMNFFGGIETVAATLGFAIDRLGINKRVQQLLLAEVDAEECPHIDCYVNETLRYFPAIPFVVRQVAEDTAVGDTTFRAGQLLVLSIIGVHHDRRYWREPKIFDCARAEFLNNSYDRRAFLPFIAGPRTCGGARLARMEITEGLKAFIRRFAVERSGNEIKFDYGLALRPNAWEQVRISRRL